MKLSISVIFKGAVVIGLSLISFGCGGSSSQSPSAATTSVSGVVMAGPASGSSVTAKSASGAVVSGPVTTGADGSYTIVIPNTALTGDLIFEASGGTFTDEATATTGVPMGTLTSYAVAGTLVAGSNVAIDPSSTIIQKLIAGGKTKVAAESAFAAAFGYTPDNSVKPVFAGMSSASTTPQRLAGLRAAAFSQLTADLTLSPGDQFALINAIAADLSDGTVDGGYMVAAKAIPADLANRFGQALVGFQMSSNNKSKLTPDKIGTPVFNKVAITPNYKVEFIPGMPAAAMGKSAFKIKITDSAGTTPATGLTNITVKPFMYMSSKSHTTPISGVTESSTPSTYDCTAYYVMSTGMTGGVSMGVWEVKVMIGTESAVFYPYVNMNMGTTPLVKLSGVVDTADPVTPVYSDGIVGMAGVKETRTWFLFDDGITKDGMASTYTVKLFTATKEMMTSFPAVYNGKVLKNDSNDNWTVSGMSVEVSGDKSTWTTLTDSGNGHWTATGITPDVSSKIYVKLTVNGLQKTTDGAAVGAANGYQTFTIVSGSGM
ncbi:MAG: hypothetical protein PHF56_04125 [Desulfuromonadaceae bacterium]|nr:hypothetical protein [Desulfuromonadaceae bacterium]